MSKTRFMSVGKPLALATLLGSGLMSGTQAWANTAANTGILNTVSVAYSDAGGSAQTPVTSSVTVTINLVPSSPTLSAPSNQTIASGGSATYNYTITTTSNGPETFNLTTTDTSTSGLTGSTATPSVGSVTLGASTYYSQASGTTIAASGNTTINVPADMTSGDPTVNGLVAGDTVIINGATFTVASVVATNNGTANALDQITLTGTGTAVTPTVGMLIAQQVAFTETVTAGTDSSSSTTQTDTAKITATDPSHTTATSNNTTVTTVAAVGLTVTKYVRDVTTPVTGSGAITVNSHTYYTSGVTGNPGDTLEYLVQVVKTASASNATSVIVTDPLLDFVTYVTSSLSFDACSAGATFTAMTDAADADAGTYTSGTNTVSFYPGTGGKGSPATGGVIGAGGAAATCNMIYQVKIN